MNFLSKLNLICVLSFLFFGYSNRIAASEKYGKNMRILKSLNIGRCTDAAVDGNTLYVIGKRKIYSFDITVPDNPVLISSLDGLGNVRQIVVQNGYAYISSREDGVFIINVKNNKKMTKLAQYDSLELATGISVSGALMVVANRQYGIETVDITNPARPVFMGMMRTGEAQSVTIKGKLAYIGDWGTMEVTICDLSNPYKPKILTRVPLDGYGDGVFVRGNLCFAATGHHARGMKKRNDPKDLAYGKGHGLEIIRVSNLDTPKVLARLKLPEFYQREIDMWDVQVSGNYAYVGDTKAGLFIIDISNPEKPFFYSHITFPEMVFRGKKINAPVGGFAIGNGVVYVAGYLSDLSVVEAKETARVIPPEPIPQKAYWEKASIAKASPSIYHPEGQVHSVFICQQEKKAIVATGSGGVHEAILFPAIEGKKILDTGSFVFDVALVNDNLFVAEGHAGLSVWKYQNSHKPEFSGRYTPKEGGVFQLLAGPSGKYMLLHVGNILDVVDISSPEKIKRIKIGKQSGPMYRLPISKQLFNNRYAGLSIHGVGCFYYDFKGKTGVEYAGKPFMSQGFPNGMTCIGDKVLASRYGSYLLQGMPDKISTPIKVANPGSIGGKPTFFNSFLYLAYRMKGLIGVYNLKNPSSPVKLWQLQIKGHPGYVSVCEDMVIIPAGREGVLFRKVEDGSPYYKK